MIDLHCHMLPGIDDGPATLEESLAMARAAVADGVTTAVLTPHVHLDRYSNTRSSIESAVSSFQQELNQHGIPLRVKAGGEVRFSIDVLDLLQNNNLPFIGELQSKQGPQKVLLLEFPHQSIPVGSFELIKKLLNLRIKPLVAHPERNKAIIADFNLARRLHSAGCLLQVTAGSLLGIFGEQPQRIAEQLLNESLMHVVATDAHNTSTRATCMHAVKTYLHNAVDAHRAHSYTQGFAESWLQA